MCCSVLQCVAVCCSVLQCVAVCCSVLQCVAIEKRKRKNISEYSGKGVLQCAAMYSSVSKVTSTVLVCGKCGTGGQRPI